MKRLLLIMLAVFCGVQLHAQRTISGKITDGDTGEGLPGVTIQVKGTTTGASTDLDGNYTLSVADGATLVISYVGFLTQEIAIGGRTTIDVALQPDTELLEEVVVIGYGETTVKDATGAVAAVSSEDFNGGVIASPEQLIQGKTAGVQITSVSGNPGDGVQLRIRGTNSVRSNNNPLFVVDGVPLSGGATASPNIGDVGTTSDVNPLNFINPADIASVSILKDASATAIYGSRGANGVVIITTKSGKGKGTKLDYSGSVSLSTPADTYDLLSGPEFLDAVAGIGGDPTQVNFGADTDWQEFILRDAVSTKHNLAYTANIGGNTTLRTSFGYENQQGILENSEMERITGRINGSRSFLNDRLNVTLSSTFSRVNREDPPVSGSSGFKGDLLGAAYIANPTWSDDPNIDQSDLGGSISPANYLANYRSTANSNRLLANLSVDYELTNNIRVKATYGADYSDADRIALLTPNALNLGTGIQDFGQGGINNNQSFSNLFELTGTYNKSVGDWDMEVLVGYSLQSFRNWGYYGSAFGFNGGDGLDSMEDELQSSFDAAESIANGIYGEGEYAQWGFSNDVRGNDLSGNPVPDGTTGFVNRISDSDEFETTYAARTAGIGVDAISANYFDNTDYLQSYFGRGNFTYKGKYLLTVTVRADGSSKFGEDERLGVFPSFAAAWQLSEESFIPDVFSTLKLRAGYGITGNQDGLTYGQFVRRERWADVFPDGGQRFINFPGTTTQGEANPGLKWEQTVQTAVGVDFGFNNERFRGTFDWYLKETEDLLLNVQIAQPALATQRFENLQDGIVENRGWELSLGYDIIDNGNVLFSIDGNIAQNKNELKDFGGQLNAGTIRGQGLTGAFAQALTGGRPLFSYFLREFQGFDQNGQPIGDVQQFVDKTALPEWNAGLSLNLEIGNFDWTAFLTGQFGHYIYNNTQNAFFTAGSLSSGRNVTRDVIGNGESVNAAADVSTRFLSPGDFVRMQSMTFGYTVPMEGNTLINNLRVTFNMQNLFLITDYSGLDPEVASNPAGFDLLNGLPTAGIDLTAYPRPRTFTLGVTASF